MRQKQPPPLSQAERVALILFPAALLLSVIAPGYGPLPLLLYLLLCAVAPFFPRWGFFLPIISRGSRNGKGIALTFDDGPCPVATPIILSLLKRYAYQATFFIIGQKAEHHPELIKEILAQGHTIGNHSWQHDSLLMLRGKKRLAEDIRKSQRRLESLGVIPLLFRPPAGITNPRLKRVLEEENLQAVTFSCRPGDGGNKKIKRLARRILDKLQAGDILLLHDLAPKRKEDLDLWQKEITTLLSSLQKADIPVLPLETLINAPVMILRRK